MGNNCIDAVVVVDMQDSFLKEHSERLRKRMISAQIDVLDACRRFGTPVVTLEYKGYGRTIGKISRAVKRVDQYSFLKKRFDNGFNEDNLKNELSKLNAQNLLFMGINASACVLYTAQGARKRGFGVATSKHLISDYSGNTRMATEWFQRNGTYFDDYHGIIDNLAQTEGAKK